MSQHHYGHGQPHRGHSHSLSYHHNQHSYRPFHYPSTSNPSTHSRQPSAPVSPLAPSERLRRPSSSRVEIPHYDAYNLNLADPFVSPVMSRTPSVAGSDRFSTVSGVTGFWPQNPDNVQPAAAYVAPFGAVQVVNEHRAGGRRGESSDEEDDQDSPVKDEAQFSPQALALINSFLDQLLYSFLSTARSTNLYALRPAVNEVLRHRLAKEAVANADEELQELLAGGEEEEEKSAHLTSKDNRKWDLELVWKRTRLRVMVYMRLGEMEDDDEERFVKEQELFYGREADSRRFSSSSGLVSWSAAIFLTSVLEYVAEQSLQAAGAVASTRARRQTRAQPLDAATAPRQFRVEDFDVEKVALDPRLGKLWRTWRKTQRNDRRPTTPLRYGMGSSSSFSRDRAASLSNLRMGGTGHSRDDSMAMEAQYRELRQRHASNDDDPEAQYPEHVLASNIPLPMRDAKRDIDEIEVPGLARNYEDGEQEDGQVVEARRSSFTMSRPYTAAYGYTGMGQFRTNFPGFPTTRPGISRRRSKSVPNPPRTPILEIPGAFPLMPEEQPEQPGQPGEAEITAEEMAPEPKASAVDMQGYKHDKHDREGSKVLLDNDVSLRQKANDIPVQPKQEFDQAQNEQRSIPRSAGIAVGATAGAAATAAAAAAYSMYTPSNEDKSLKKDFNQTHEQTPQREQDAALARPRKRSSREIEELDKRKSLMGLKSVMQTEDARQPQEDSLPHTPVAAENTFSQPQDVIIDHAALVNKQASSGLDQQGDPRESIETVPAVNRESMDEGVSPKALNKIPSNRQDATTMAALEAPASPAERMGDVPAEQKARDMPMIGLPKTTEKPERLVIMGDPPRGETEPSQTPGQVEQSTRSPPRSPREFLRSSDQSAGAEDEREAPRGPAPQSPNDKTRASAPQRQSVITLPSTPTSEQNARVQDPKTWQSAREQRASEASRGNSVNQRKPSKGEVSNHTGVVNVGGTPKKDANALANGNGTSTPPVVTSANIRGPEDFDNFLQRDDTVKYTLTPDSVRDNPSRPSTSESKFVTARKMSDTASVSKLSRQASEGTASVPRKNSSPAPSSHRQSRIGRTQSIKEEEPVPTPPQNVDEAKRERRRSVSKPAPRNTSTNRRSGLIAREPQVMTASTRDFADFIRSTGPDREPEVHRLHTNRSTTSLHSMRNAARSGSASGASTTERTKSLTNTTMAAENIPPVPRMPASESKRPKTQMQARSATGAGGGNRDLINFIRDGPDEGSHRISRTVAPFRNTMDSDRFDEMGGDFASTKNANGKSANRNSVLPPPSSAPSRNTVSEQSVSQPQRSGANSSANDSMGDGKKRYRNKDPYAIPSDSEDEDDEELLSTLPRKPEAPKEESLVDFLRNNEPPSNNSPRPINGTSTATANRQSQAPDPRPKPVQANGTVPTQTNATPRENGPKLEARGAGAPRQRIPRGNAGARLGAYEETNTGDLADFLRSSGPAENSSPAAPAPVVGRQEQAAMANEEPKKKKKSFFSFGRKKDKAEKKSYIDVP